MKERQARVEGILNDLYKSFLSPEYTSQLQAASKPAAIRRMIRQVHLECLPKYGFPLKETTPEREAGFLLRRFLAHLNSVCSAHPKLSAVAAHTLEISGVNKIATLRAENVRKVRQQREAARIA